MWDWQRVLSLILSAVMIALLFGMSGSISDFWGLLLYAMFPVILSVACIWFPDEVDAWSERPSPRWMIKAVGWLVLLITFARFTLVWWIT